MTFGLGPAGTGKTYLAVAMAVSALMARRVSRIILVRPALEAGERLGFLPGTLQEKVDPYLRPAVRRALRPAGPGQGGQHAGAERDRGGAAGVHARTDAVGRVHHPGRGRRNTTIEQMKMFVTRMGNGSKAVITGDLTQIDLPNPKKSGLFDALRVLEGVEGIRFCHFEDVDVVRHSLVQRIVRAYDSYGRAQQLALELGDAGLADAVEQEQGPGNREQ